MRDVGVARVDFREDSAYSLLNYSLGERGSDWSLLSAMACLLKPGDVLWDVGANIGYFTQHFAQPRFHLREINAFEPNPAVRKTLDTLFERNARVHVHGVALGDENARREIHFLPNASAEGSLVRQVSGARSIPIEVRRADDYKLESGLAAPDMIKIDVEGFEPQVLAGMQKIVAQNSPAIFFEHIWLSEEAIRKCQPPGYELLFLLDDGTLTSEFDARLRGANAIFIPSAKITQLPASFPREGAE
jgi:FkbM family methyltransferase